MKKVMFMYCFSKEIRIVNICIKCPNLTIKRNYIVKSSRDRIKRIWIGKDLIENNDIENFKKELYYSSELEVNKLYAVLPKIFKDNMFFNVSAKQHGFRFDTIESNSFNILYRFLKDKMDVMLQNYDFLLKSSYDGIILEFFPVVVSEEYTIKSMEKLVTGVSGRQLSIFKKGVDFFGVDFLERKGLPVKLDFNNLDNNTSITNMEFIKGFLENKRLSNKTYYDLKEGSEFYIINVKNRKYYYIINKLDENIISKRGYNEDGKFIIEIIDTLKEDKCIKREVGNMIYLLNENKEIIYVKKNINFSSISPDFIVSKDKGLPNPWIGVIDLETYEDEGIGKCFAIGFYIHNDSKPTSFYIDKDLNSYDLIIKCIEELLRPKYNHITFYIHNLGRFDAPYIIKALSIYNSTEEGKAQPYIIECVTRDTDIIKLNIKRRFNKKLRVLKIHDSVAILPFSLRDLCKDYEIDIQKSYFPYSFCKKNTLFYKGKTPSKDYYENISIEIYSSLIKEVWDLKEECIKYLEKDLLSLYKVLEKVNKVIYMLFDIQMVDNLSISAIAMRIFFRFYQNYLPDKNRQLPLISQKGVFDDIQKAYYGGRVEVYKPVNLEQRTLYYYDINSLYPYASLNDLPGRWCEHYIMVDENYLDILDLFGFFHCKIKSSDNYLGLLPLRTKTGLIFPVGEWEGWYFSEELIFAKEHGYDIKIIEGYNFSKSTKIFDEFVNEIYRLKSNYKNKTERNVAKLVLNSLIGRFGMDVYKNVTELVDKLTHNTIATTRILKNSIEIDENLYLDNYKPIVDKEICDAFGINYFKVLSHENINEKKSYQKYRSVSISTAAAINAYARIIMARIILLILSKGGNIFYSDTDSLVTDMYIPDEFVSSDIIGKFRLEHEIIEAYFLGDKFYAFKTKDGKLVKITKGVNSSSLSWEDFKKLYNNEILNNVEKTTSVRNYQEGSVTIQNNKNIRIDFINYKKREKVIVNNKWIDTKPYNITNVDL